MCLLDQNDDNNDLSEEETETDNSCTICFEKYNESDRHQCVLHCGHSTCERCLALLTVKTCPVCRKPFTDENIIMMFQH